MSATAKKTATDLGVWGDVLVGQDLVFGLNGADPFARAQYNSLFYDALGNPLCYFSGGEEQYSMTWSGRRLSSVTVGNKTTSYTYNVDGIIGL